MVTNLVIEALVAGSAHPAFTLDADRRLISANAAAIAMLVLDWPGALGRPLHQFLERDGATADPHPCADHNPSGWELAVAILAPDERRSLFILEHSVFAASGHVEGFVVLLRPRDQSADALGTRLGHSVEGASERLAGGVAHDFDNVLAIISGHLQMAQRRTDDASLSDHLRQALLACAMGGRMTRRLKAYARSQFLRPVPTDINALIAPLIEAFRRPLADRIDLVLDLTPNLPAIAVDPAGFEGMLLNLLLNAADATAPRGRISISTRLEDQPGGVDDRGAKGGSPQYVVLAVADSGSGMTPEVAERAFEPFFSTKGPEHGSGLGLATVAGFARQSGGTVELSTRVGSGTEVTVRLPVTRPFPARRS